MPRAPQALGLGQGREGEPQMGKCMLTSLAAGDLACQFGEEMNDLFSVAIKENED